MDEILKKQHTTELGIYRIMKNLNIDCHNVIEWCKEEIKNCYIVKEGKNYYAINNKYIFTINSNSYTLITAHFNCKLLINKNNCNVEKCFIKLFQKVNPEIMMEYSFNNINGWYRYDIVNFNKLENMTYVQDLSNDFVTLELVYGENHDTNYNGMIETRFKNKIGNYIYTIIDLDGDYKIKFKGYIKIDENNL